MDKAEKSRLIALIKQASPPLVPQPPLLPPKWEALCYAKLEGMKAVLFDVYGTLFCSAVGDISLAAKETGEKNDALEALAGEYGLAGMEMRSFFRKQVAAIHSSLSAQTQWPEVKVEEIWTEFLRQQGVAENSLLRGEPGRELALRYELAVNPVYPMPGAFKTIVGLREKGVILGIISNAQFFTPLLFEAFFGEPTEKLGFDPHLVIWSFEHGRAKPSPQLFQTAAERLRAIGVTAEQCAFAGNDMLSDMYGAVNAGFKGVLFAGDSRSLRLREGDERLIELSPHMVIRKLEELL